MTYVPESLVTAVWTKPVSMCVTDTFTFGTDAPDGSVMVPTIVASCAFAVNERATKATSRTAKWCNRTCFRAVNTLRPHEENRCIYVPPTPHDDLISPLTYTEV